MVKPAGTMLIFSNKNQTFPSNRSWKIFTFPIFNSLFITGDRNKGWYYGENVRTGKRGWFPLAYTEQVKDADVDSG